MLAEIETSGITLALAGDDRLQVTGAITEEQRKYLKQHKPELLIALKARERILQAAPELTEELMAWYADDYEALVKLNDQSFNWLIRDYKIKRDIYLHRIN